MFFSCAANQQLKSLIVVSRVPVILVVSAVVVIVDVGPWWPVRLSELAAPVRASVRVLLLL